MGRHFSKWDRERAGAARSETWAPYASVGCGSTRVGRAMLEVGFSWAQHDSYPITVAADAGYRGDCAQRGRVNRTDSIAGWILGGLSATLLECNTRSMENYETAFDQAGCAVSEAFGESLLEELGEACGSD